MQEVEQVPEATDHLEELSPERQENQTVEAIDAMEEGKVEESPAHSEEDSEQQEDGQEQGDEQEDVIVAEALTEPSPAAGTSHSVKAVIEAAIYITDEPLSAEQIAAAVEQPIELVKEILAELVTEYSAPGRGLSIRELAGGYKMSTKPEHHEAIRRFVKNLQPPLKLSLAALETLAVIAYKQPITGPEIMEIRGVQGAGVLKTLLDRKLIAGAGRKNVIGKPILYKTTREFLIQFGLNSLAELPTLKEFEELGRLALSESEEYTGPSEPETPATPHDTNAEAPRGEENSVEVIAEVASDEEAALTEAPSTAEPPQPEPTNSEETDVKPADA